MKKNRHLLIQSALVLAFLATPLYGAEAYDDKKVTRIEVVLESSDPTATIDSRAITIQMKTREGADFSQHTFDADLKTLSDQYADSYDIDPTVRTKDNQVYITLTVKKKPKIHQIEFSGNEKVSSSTLKSELDVKPGTTFTPQKFNKSFNKVKSYYVKKGYFESQLDYTVVPISDSDEVDIEVHVVEGRPGIIKRVELKGFTKAEKSHIEEEMYLKKYNFLYSWLTGTGIYSDEAMEQDRMTILHTMHDNGFADARIDIKMEEDPKSGKLVLEIICERGEEYHIGTIKIEGNTLISEEDLRKRLTIKEGGIYSPRQIHESEQAMKDFYGQKGYIDASVTHETPLKEDGALYDVQFTIDEGQQYKIGLVHIFGNTSTKSNVILRESLLVPGDTFDSRKLKKTQQRLEGVGYFKSVNVYAVRTEDDASMGDNYRDVYIEVEEASTGNVSLFAGFSSSDSVFGGLDLTERNFHIANIGNVFKGDLASLRGGGEYFHIRGTAGTRQYNVLVSWLNPYVNDSLWRLGVEVTSTFSELQSKQTKVITTGGSVYTSYPLNNYWTAGMRQRVRQIVDKLNIDAKDSSAIAQESLQQTKHEFQQDGVISAFSGNLSYDSVDNTYKPRRGWRSYLEPEIAGLGGRFHFGKLSFTNSLYFPVWKKGTFKVRGDFKFIVPYSRTDKANAPYSERFFLGGDTSMRGYKPWAFGPRIYLTNAAGASVADNTPKGGLSSVYFSFEYNQEIIKMLDIFGFLDVGSLSASILTVDKFRASAGGGLRIDIGNRTPIMLGWGYVFNHSDRENKNQPFFFSMGGAF